MRLFLCTLACHVAFELDQRLAPLLFTDTTPTAPVDPVAPAQRSPAAKTKAGSQTTPDGHPAHNRADLLTPATWNRENHAILDLPFLALLLFPWVT